MTLSGHMIVTLAIIKSNFCYVNYHNCPAAADTAAVTAAAAAAVAAAGAAAAEAADDDDDAAAAASVVAADAAGAADVTNVFAKSQRGYLTRGLLLESGSDNSANI